MVDSPQTSLKVIFIVHLVLTTWASMCGSPFLDTAYVYFNGFILVFAVWAIIAPDSTDAVLMFLLLNLISIVQDIIFLASLAPYANDYYSLGRREHLYQFTLGMAIVNLLIKPFTSFVLYRIYQSRGGRYGDLLIPGVPNFSGPSSAPGYEDLETNARSPHLSNVETATPHNTYKPPE